MNICLISCYYRHRVYGYYTISLQQALERELQRPVKMITACCSCFEGQEKRRMLLDERCQYVSIPYASDYSSKNPAKRQLRRFYREGSALLRGLIFAARSRNAQVIHFQQVLRAFGYDSLKPFLSCPSSARRVVTVHELDPVQKQHPELNKIYNKADAIVVHTKAFSDELINTGVEPQRLHVIPYGVKIGVPEDGRSNTIVYYGGHHLTKGKGFHDLLQALQLLREKELNPLIFVFGNYPEKDIEQGRGLARSCGVHDFFQWDERPGQREESEVHELYRKALFSIVPYTGGSASYPVTMAMANKAPLIATNLPGIEEYVGNCGLLIEPGNPEMLASAIERLMTDDKMREHLSRQAYDRASEQFDWFRVAQQTIKLYQSIM
jgi:glycosyltransferase involved in cell wall biosynthesis